MSEATTNPDFGTTDKNRIVYLIVCLVGAFVVGLAYTWAVLQAPFVQQLGGESVISIVVLCYTVTVLCSTMTPSVLGSITKKWGPKKTIFIGTILFGLGYIVSGYATSLPLFFIAFGVGTGVGSGMIYPTIMGYMVSLFPDRQGLVSGILAGVYGGAAIVWSPLLANMIAGQGLDIALLMAGLVSLIVIIPVSLIIKPVPSGYIEYKRTEAGKKEGAKKTGLPDQTRGEMVKTLMFYVAIGAFALGCTSGMMVVTQISIIMQKSFGLGPTEAAAYVSLIAFASMIGRFLWGAVTDHFNKYTTLSIICGLPFLAIGILVFSHAQGLTVVCLAITALCYGGFGSTIAPITADLFGSKYVTENYGVMYLAFGFAALVGPQVAVGLRNEGDYSMAFLVSAAISLVAFILALIVRKKVQDSLKAA